ncbi:hypothetical protein LEP1GSC062_1538 [Leptospira alexanderi serovar Manhao 3 str. L 60]|uniref:Uncharacterized protein n=1 Tax=Leptospira alexanderi serovar Manhao 3 str. L 60 TaxID=1049759 RepID=V6HTR9_9LEPT|nr:hypothetical protein LEP1GSC062_1538 [Leptospira alexanderi serovar Manhao 3 str. L 60]
MVFFGHADPVVCVELLIKLGYLKKGWFEFVVLAYFLCFSKRR